MRIARRILARAFWALPDEFDNEGRRAWSSVNLLTAHDGFTLADVTRYNERHNEANGEDGADGHHGNYSDNCGVEGDTDDPVILQTPRASAAQHAGDAVFVAGHADAAGGR